MESHSVDCFGRSVQKCSRSRIERRFKIAVVNAESGFEIKPVYREGDVAPDVPIGEPGEFPYTCGVCPTMYTKRPWTDAAVRGFRHRGRVERALSPTAGGGHDGAVGRVRPAHPDEVRLGRGDRAPRGRQGRGGHRLAGRHATALRRQPARPRVDLDDDQRARLCAVAAPSARRRGTGVAGTALQGTIQNDILKEYIARGTTRRSARPRCHGWPGCAPSGTPGRSNRRRRIWRRAPGEQRTSYR